MDRLQVAVATMKQKDFSLAEKMNLRCDAVIANQADREEITVHQSEKGTWKMITTATRGVGLNRNIALLAADREILLFADEDVTYNDDMPQQVMAAFAENPKADVMIFSMDLVKGGEVIEKRHLQKKRLRVWNAMRFGTYTIAIRRASLLKANICFHQMFGGGCRYGSGEDSLFLKACFDRKLRVYAHSYVLGTCCKDESSWFTGFNKKFFYDKGVLLGQLFPRIPRLMAVYFAIRFRENAEVSAYRQYRLMLAGIKGGKTFKPYCEDI